MADQSANAEDKRTASRRVADSVIAGIERGTWKVGEPLPTYRQLAADEAVAVNTAMAGVRLAAVEGWVEIRPNAGGFVRDRSRDASAEHELRELRAKVEDLRMTLRRVGDVLSGADVDLADVVTRINVLAGAGTAAQEDGDRADAAMPSGHTPSQATT